MGAIRGHVQVTVPATTLAGTTLGGAQLNGKCAVDPETAKILAGNAPGFDRVFLDPITGTVLAVDRRFATPAPRPKPRQRERRKPLACAALRRPFRIPAAIGVVLCVWRWCVCLCRTFFRNSPAFVADNRRGRGQLGIRIEHSLARACYG